MGNFMAENNESEPRITRQQTVLRYPDTTNTERCIERLARHVSYNFNKSGCDPNLRVGM